MTVSSGKLPSAGFVAFMLTCLAVLAFFCWALATPPLDRVWTIHHLMKIGEMKRLPVADRALLEREMAEHADLTRDLLDGKDIGIISAHSDGWIATTTATLLRTPASRAVRALRIDVQAAPELLPLHLTVRSATVAEEREVTGEQLLVVPLAPPRENEILEVTTHAPTGELDRAAVAIRVTWESAP